MATNENTGHHNRHTLYVGCSGAGKSQALLQNKEIPARGARVLLWDIDNDHAARRYDNRRAFVAAVRAGIASGRGFRIAWSGADDPETFEWWCRVVWEALNGNRLTFVIIEELADVSPSAGKATPWFGKLLRRGRKYGAVLHMTTQRGTEISKTCYTQAGRKWIGQQEANDVRRMAQLAAVPESEVAALESLQFLVKPQGAAPAERVNLRYKKPRKTPAAA